jgi:hypothetical protein
MMIINLNHRVTSSVLSVNQEKKPGTYVMYMRGLLYCTCMVYPWLS